MPTLQIVVKNDWKVVLNVFICANELKHAKQGAQRSAQKRQSINVCSLLHSPLK